jgi:hypothetical protein
MEFVLDVRLWNRPDLDLWIVPNLLFGMLFALLLLYKSKDQKAYIQGFFMIVFVALLWELVEIVSGVYEATFNRLADIMLIITGYILIGIGNAKRATKRELTIAIGIAFSLLCITNILGLMARV